MLMLIRRPREAPTVKAQHRALGFRLHESNRLLVSAVRFVAGTEFILTNARTRRSTLVSLHVHHFRCRRHWPTAIIPRRYEFTRCTQPLSGLHERQNGLQLLQ